MEKKALKLSTITHKSLASAPTINPLDEKNTEKHIISLFNDHVMRHHKNYSFVKIILQSNCFFLSYSEIIWIDWSQVPSTWSLLLQLSCIGIATSSTTHDSFSSAEFSGLSESGNGRL